MSTVEHALGFLPRSSGEGDHAQHGGGGARGRCPFGHGAQPSSGGPPSTALRAVPLHRVAGEEPAAPFASGWWAFASQARALEAIA